VLELEGKKFENNGRMAFSQLTFNDTRLIHRHTTASLSFTLLIRLCFVGSAPVTMQEGFSAADCF
jgi:hypothetical protein